MKETRTFGPFSHGHHYPLFVGREQELDALQKAILHNKERVVAISGRNAIGKTCLWKAFMSGPGADMARQTEVVSLYRTTDDFPEIRETTRLVIIEDLSFDFVEHIHGKIVFLIGANPGKQFLLVSAFSEFLEKFSPLTHLRLEALPKPGSLELLLKALGRTLPDGDLAKIASFTQGSPLLINLVAHYLSKGRYDLDGAFKHLSDDLRYQDYFLARRILQPERSRELTHVVSDIRLVNHGLLDAIRKNPEAMYSLTSRQFEEMVAELMSKRGYHVDLTKATRDGGKDLIIASHVDIGNFIYYVECKKYSPSNPVGVNLVRELVGTISADRVTAGIMITSSYFSPDAVDYSEKLKHQLSLVDFLKLKEWINTCQ